MVILGFLLLMLIPVSMFYSSIYLIELIRTWKYTTAGAKIGQASVSIVCAIIFVVVIYVLLNY